LHRQLADLGWPVSPATLSNWRNGRTLPVDVPASRARVMALEAVLDLTPGRLVQSWYSSRLGEDMVPATRTPSPAARLHSPADVLDNKEIRKNAMFRRIEIETSGGWLSRNYLVPVVVEEDVLLGPDGLPLRSTITLTVYALVPGVDQYWYVYAFRGTDPDVGVRVTPLTGCKLGDHIQMVERVQPSRTVDEVVMATQLRFAEELPPFTLHRLSYSVDYDYPEQFTGYLRPEFIRVVPTPGTRQLRLSIAFDNRARPQRLTRSVWTPDPDKADGGFDTPVWRADRQDTQRDQVTVTNPRTPRGYGWTWSSRKSQSPATRTRLAGQPPGSGR
jgi:hypothetical protein